MKSILEICAEFAEGENQPMLNKAANKLRQVRREAYRVTITLAMEQAGAEPGVSVPKEKLQAAAQNLGITVAALKRHIRDLALPYCVKRGKYQTHKVRANRNPHQIPIQVPKPEPATIEPADKKPARRISAEQLTGLLDVVNQRKQVFL